MLKAFGVFDSVRMILLPEIGNQQVLSEGINIKKEYLIRFENLADHIDNINNEEAFELHSLNLQGIAQALWIDKNEQ
jgi:hypothetical protein